MSALKFLVETFSIDIASAQIYLVAETAPRLRKVLV